MPNRGCFGGTDRFACVVLAAQSQRKGEYLGEKEDGKSALVSKRAVHQMQKWQPCFAPLDVIYNDICGTAGPGVCRNVWRDGYPGMRPERVVCGQRFNPEHIQRCMAKAARV